MRTTQRQDGLCLLRIAATALVIWFHTCSTLTAHPRLYAETAEQYRFFLAAGSAASWHVPVFFMLTGALLLDRERVITPGMCVKRYALRMVLALGLFGIPFALMSRVFAAGTLTPDMLWRSALDVLTGDSWEHLWYVYALIGIYLLLPMLRAFCCHGSRREMGYVLGVLLGFDFFLYMAGKIGGIRIAFSVPVVYTVFYCLLGRYLADGLPRLLRSRALCVGVLVLIGAASAATAALAPKWIGVFTNYASPANALGAAAAFSLLAGVSVPERWRGRLWRLDRLCFGVYLIHPLFVHGAYSFLGLTPLSFRLYPAAAVCFFLAFSGLAFFASWVMSLIPPLRKYVL